MGEMGRVEHPSIPLIPLPMILLTVLLSTTMPLPTIILTDIVTT